MEEKKITRKRIEQEMNGILEESKQIQPYVLIAQPRRDERETPAQHFEGYQGVHIDLSGYTRAFAKISGEMVDVARNYLMEVAIDSGAKYLLFIGEDTVLPYNAFHILHETAEKNPDAIVVGVYYVKLSVPMIMIRKNNHVVPANVDPGQILEAWQTGLDCALIPISILKKLKEEEPDLPFCCIHDPNPAKNPMPGIPFIGEDNFFVYRIRKHGYKLLVNTDVQCLHMDLENGKYTAHPGIDEKNYVTNIPLKGRLTEEDREFIEKRYVARIPKGSGNK